MRVSSPRQNWRTAGGLLAVLILTMVVYGRAAAQASAPLGGQQPAIPDPQAKRLSLQQAVQLALENNVNALLARERVGEARGRAAEARAGLLPDLSGSVAQRNETVNLAAMGFQSGLFPGALPLLIGPFNNFDARARLAQCIFNWSAIRRYQAGRAGVTLANLEERLARQQVAVQAAVAYLNTVSADRAVEAVRSNLDLAQSLLQLARDQRDAGVATGVDVTRAETRLAEEQVRLAQAQTTAQQARLTLLRTAGLPLSGAVALTDPLQFIAEPLLPAEQTVTEAGRERVEVQIAQEQVRLSEYNLGAVRAERLPSLDFVGDYGESGNTPALNAVPTRTVGVRLNIPLFDGGRTNARITEARSQQRQAALRLTDTRAQVEEDVRLSLQNVVTTAEQVRAARQSVTLAERELQMARDRFAAGVANNLEVINAQVSLATAREAEVRALAQHNAARINLAAARGRIEAFRW